MIGLVSVMVGLVGCGDSVTPEPAPEPAEAAPAAPTEDPRVTRAAAVANAIAAGTVPEEAMAEQGLEPQQFRDLLYEIAENPKLTDAYLKARE